MQELQILKQGPFPPPSLTNSHISLIKRQSDCIFKLLNKAMIIIWGFYYPCSYFSWAGKQPALLGWREQPPQVSFFLFSQTAGSGNNDLWILIKQDHGGLFSFRLEKLKPSQNEFIIHQVFMAIWKHISIWHTLFAFTPNLTILLPSQMHTTKAPTTATLDPSLPAQHLHSSEPALPDRCNLHNITSRGCRINRGQALTSTAQSISLC